jgi:hypothetical protein
MWNVSRFAIMAAAAGAGLAATATSAVACFDWGYSGAYSYGPAYARTGFTSYPAYHDVSCSGAYNIPGWGECGGYGPCGWAPLAPPVVVVPPAPREVADSPPAAGAVAVTRRVRRHLRD